MRPGPLFTLLLVLAAGPAFAQSAPTPSEPPLVEPPLVEVPGAEVPAGPTAKPAAREPQVYADRPSRLPRIAVEALAGTGLAVAAGLLANEAGGPGYIFVGGPLGMAVGIWGGGFMMDGDGHPLAVLGGAAVGLVAGLYLGAALAGGGSGSDLSYWYVTTGITTLVGGIVGFELGSSDSRSLREGARQRFAWLPLLAPTRDGQGAVIGFAFQL